MEKWIFMEVVGNHVRWESFKKSQVNTQVMGGWNLKTVLKSWKSKVSALRGLCSWKVLAWNSAPGFGVGQLLLISVEKNKIQQGITYTSISSLWTFPLQKVLHIVGWDAYLPSYLIGKLACPITWIKCERSTKNSCLGEGVGDVVKFSWWILRKFVAFVDQNAGKPSNQLISIKYISAKFQTAKVFFL